MLWFRSVFGMLKVNLNFPWFLIHFSFWVLKISEEKFIIKGDSSSEDQLPLACKDAVAILFMFDLTSRRTLNRFVVFVKNLVILVWNWEFEFSFVFDSCSVVDWYTEAKKWNQVKFVYFLFCFWPLMAIREVNVGWVWFGIQILNFFFVLSNLSFYWTMSLRGFYC